MVDAGLLDMPRTCENIYDLISRAYHSEVSSEFFNGLFSIEPFSGITIDCPVREYVEAESVSCPLLERETLRWAILIGPVLEAANYNNKDIIQRDLKSPEFMLAEEGSMKLLDLSLAKLYEREARRCRPVDPTPRHQKSWRFVCG